jgi:hypothetical protein
LSYLTKINFYFSRNQVKVEATVIEKTLSHFHVRFDYRPRRDKIKRFNSKYHILCLYYVPRKLGGGRGGIYRICFYPFFSPSIQSKSFLGERFSSVERTYRITSVLKVETDISTSIAVSSIGNQTWTVNCYNK